MKKIEGGGEQNSVEQEEAGWSRKLADKIIREARKLGRPLDSFDAEPLARIIKESLRDKK